MRSPQRKFVVEIKSRSRKPKAATPTSIWGDTDLKAVSRQLDEQTEGPFAPLRDLPGVTLAKAAGEEVSSSIAELDHPSSLKSGDAPLRSDDTTTETTADPTSEAANEQCLPLPAVTAPGKRRATAKRKARRTPKTPYQSQDKEERHVTRAELEGLIAENISLKTELRNRLTADNKHLQELLARFS